MTAPHEFRQIIPTPPPEVEEIFIVYQTTSQFYREVETRTAKSLYCAWYYEIAASHRQELQQMRGELNILGWFRRSRYS
jgi:hypothetical protein